TATLLPDGRVLVTGGASPGVPADASIQSAEVFDPATGTFTLVGPMVKRRALHVATPLADGRVLLTGGFALLDPPTRPTSDAIPRILKSAEVFDPQTNTFPAVADMNVRRSRHAAVALADGRVLVTGGFTTEPLFVETATAELFDPNTGTFTPTGDMSVPRR